MEFGLTNEREVFQAFQTFCRIWGSGGCGNTNPKKKSSSQIRRQNKRNKTLEEHNDLNIQPTSILSDALNARLKQKSKDTEVKKTYCPICDT